MGQSALVNTDVRTDDQGRLVTGGNENPTLPAVINVDGDGWHTILAAADQDQVVTSIDYVTTLANGISWYSGDTLVCTLVCGRQDFPANGGKRCSSGPGDFVLRAAAGQPLRMRTTVNTHVGGELTYHLEDA